MYFSAVITVCRTCTVHYLVCITTMYTCVCILMLLTFSFLCAYLVHTTHVQCTIIIREDTAVCVRASRVCVSVCAMGGGFHKNRLPRTLWKRFRFSVSTTFHREDSVTDIKMMRV